ncbi:MAG: hypothetical protein K9N49_02535 [Candidatus Marinimicrobia bacterium]|nr:hypothetical protein [Candidatus Neomarinimicrobiota bacterium]
MLLIILNCSCVSAWRSGLHLDYVWSRKARQTGQTTSADRGISLAQAIEIALSDMAPYRAPEWYTDLDIIVERTESLIIVSFCEQLRRRDLLVLGADFNVRYEIDANTGEILRAMHGG